MSEPHAISTYKTFLMKETGDTGETFTKLVDIKDFPDMGGEPDLIETTTLSDAMQTFIEGVKSSGALPFTANFEKTDFATLKTLDGVETGFALWFGGTVTDGVLTPTGDKLKLLFKGYLSVRITSGGVNDPVNMGITIVPTTEITVGA